jgi:hypothetical protein
VEAPEAADVEVDVEVLLAAGAVATAGVAGAGVASAELDSDDLAGESLETGGTAAALPPSRKSVTYQPEPFN